MESSESRLTVAMFCNENVNFFRWKLRNKEVNTNAELSLKELQLFAACTKINETSVSVGERCVC